MCTDLLFPRESDAPDPNSDSETTADDLHTSSDQTVQHVGSLFSDPDDSNPDGISQELDRLHGGMNVNQHGPTGGAP